MSTKTFALSAGVPYPVHMSGEYFRILDSTGAVDVLFRSQNRALQDDVQGVLAGFALSLPAGKGFDYFELLSATSQSVQVFAGSSRVEYDRAAGTVSVSGNVREARSAAVGGSTPYTIGTSAVALGGVASRTKLYFRAEESNTADIALGNVAVTFASAPIRLAPGEVWIEKEGSDLQWYAISTAAGQALDYGNLAI